MNEGNGCGLEAWGGVAVPWGELPTLRQSPGLAPLTQHLKTSDDQTVLAAAAVQRALDCAGWKGRSFQDWGVVAAPRSLGRCRIAITCARYRRNLLRGYNPLIIPHQ